jgi:pseudomonalisin
MTRGRRSLMGAAASAAAALVCCTAALGAPAGTASLVTRGSTDLGRASQHRAIVLVLANSHPAALQSFLAQPHAALTPQAFAARFGPSHSSAVGIARWARRHRLRVDSVASNFRFVRVSGSTTALGRALGVRFDRLRASNGSVYVSSMGTARLPAAIAAGVASIVGLSDLGRTSTKVRAHRAQLPVNLGGLPVIPVSGLPAAPPALPSVSAGTPSYPASYTPQQLWALYNAPTANTGSGQHVAVIAEGDVSQPKADLVTFENRFGLPKVPWNQINVGTASSDKSGADEWDLDTQYSTGFAPNVSQLDVYVAPSLSNGDIITTMNRWVTDDTSKQASFSAGECEVLAAASGFMNGLDPVLAQAAAQGQTMFTSSGDTGSQCPALVAVNGVPAGIPGPNYPASCPYAIGVGGTSVLATNPTTEVTWYATGGGASTMETAPAFQTGAGGSFLGQLRGVPDVALDADPESGYDVIVNGQQAVIGGTSASAPSWQGIWARAQGAHGGNAGFAGPVIYTTEPASAFHDILLGGNGLYVATPGWDYVTGRGTPDITAFVNGA